MPSYSVGTKALRVGAIGAEGVMGTLIASDAVKPYKGTVVFQEGDPTKTPHYTENKRFPDIVVTEAGELNFNYEVHDISKENLEAYLGGTADGVSETWSSDTDHFSVEKSVELDTIYGETWQFARVHLTGSIIWNANRTDVMRIKVSGMIMEPEGVDTPPLKKIPTA